MFVYGVYFNIQYTVRGLINGIDPVGLRESGCGIRV